MKIKKPPFILIREFENKGLVCSLSNIVKRKRTENNETLNRYARKQLSGYTAIFSEDQGEDVLMMLNDFIEEKGLNLPHLGYPLSEGTDFYLIPFTEHLTSIVQVTDEYFGGGDYSQYVDMGYFVIDKETTTKDVDVLIDWLCEKGLAERQEETDR